MFSEKPQRCSFDNGKRNGIAAAPKGTEQEFNGMNFMNQLVAASRKQQEDSTWHWKLKVEGFARLLTPRTGEL
jgi:hypothetical protein